MESSRRKTASLAPIPTSCLLIGSFVLVRSCHVIPTQYSIKWKLEPLFQSEMNISLSEVLTAQISRNELNLDYGRIISIGSINSRIPQELVKWFPSARKSQFFYPGQKGQ